MCEQYVSISPGSRLDSPEVCYCGCGWALGSWVGFARHTPGGAYGTHPAVEAITAHYCTESRSVNFVRSGCREINYLHKS